MTAFATGVAGGPTLFLGLLLEGFYLAPRGMGAIPAIATEADIDDLAAPSGGRWSRSNGRRAAGRADRVTDDPLGDRSSRPVRTGCSRSRR